MTQIERERHTDVLDRASELEMAETQSSINRISAKVQQKQRPRPDGTYEHEDCEDCGSDIGAERLKVAANNHLCIHCAEARERLGKVWAK